MKKAKRVFKILLFVLFIFLAALGVGISGGVPIPINRSERDKKRDDIELVQEEDQTGSSFKVK